MTETVYSFFENNAVPVEWLTPSIEGIDWANNENLFSDTMTEVWSGRYKYNIVNYNKGATYLITVDGGVSLPNGIRYQSVINELDAYPNKLDRRSISTRTINNDEIAKAVRDYKGTIKEWSVASLLCKDIDYKVIGLQFEDMKKEINKLNNDLLKEHKWLSLKDIETIISKHSNNDEISKVVSLLKWIQEMNDILKGECIEIKEICNKFDIWIKVDDIAEKISKVSDKIENMEVENINNMVEWYSQIIEHITSSKKINDKIIWIRLWIDDILSKL